MAFSPNHIKDRTDMVRRTQLHYFSSDMVLALELRCSKFQGLVRKADCVGGPG